MYSLPKFEISYRKGLLLSLSLGFAVRLIPEILSYPYPIGYDTVHYAAMTKNGVVWYHWTSVFSTWLLYGILTSLYSLSQVDPFLLLKVIAPLLYALSACGIYYFSKHALNWDVHKSLIAGFFFVFQLAAFRISWDLLRNTLGMAVLLFAVPLIRSLETRKEFVGFVLLSMLVVFGHELASVVMFVVVFGLGLKVFLEGERMRAFEVFSAVLPALALFVASLFFAAAPVYVEANVIGASQPAVQPGGLFFLANYLDPAYYLHYPSYFELASHVLSLFAILYLVCLPLVFVGFFRDVVLDVWGVFLLAASLSCLVFPFFALLGWHRWLFMLVYPFTFYVANGVQRVRGSSRGVRPSWKWLGWMKVSRRTAVGILCCSVLLTSFYVASTLQSDSCVVFSIPTISRYFSVAPTVPLQDVESTVRVMDWLNGRMDDGSCVLVQEAFLSWALLYLDNGHVIVSYAEDVDAALNVALTYEFSPVYLVWWGENIGWYGVTVPNHFSPVFESGRMSAFEY